jgi:chitin disaccharide deacetylase
MTEPRSEISTAQNLAYPRDARVLIINAHEFDMCHDENEAIIEGLASGLFTSATVLVTCPWFEEAAEFARHHSSVDLGVHLTLASEWERYKWGPVLGRAAVPSLIDGRGYLWQDVPQVYEHDRLDEAEAELRAQIDKALAARIGVTHLDSHMGPLHLRADYHDIYRRLAHDYRLPLPMVSRRAPRQIEAIHSVLDSIERDGTCYPDNFNGGGPRHVDETQAYWTTLIRNLRAGITEIHCHPALARTELLGCARDARQREADFRFFTSDQARKLIRDEGMELCSAIENCAIPCTPQEPGAGWN